MNHLKSDILFVDKQHTLIMYGPDLVSALCKVRNLRGGLQEQFGDRPLNSVRTWVYITLPHVGDLDTLKTLLQEDRFKQWDFLLWMIH